MGQSVILFSQHGMGEGNQKMKILAQRVATPDTQIIVPNLNFFTTFLTLDPLIKKVEISATETLEKFPNLSFRVIGFSLGGVLWVEVLSRHPDWLERLESIVLLGSPIRGASLAKTVDPFGWGVGIAQELGRSRQYLAEKITQKIPTLVIAGSLNNGGDGVIPIESTRLKYTHFYKRENVRHQDLAIDRIVSEKIKEFFQNPSLVITENTRLTRLIEHFQHVEGMTPADERDFSRSTIQYTFVDGITLREWVNPVGVRHIFIADAEGNCQFSGFTGWVHDKALRRAIAIAQTL
ncbi:alpha/beta hydrolase [Synechococcus moorigangaii CMS01]|nr:alpha/beta hydrolase [Synechococcus moorigangaii CMS01]